MFACTLHHSITDGASVGILQRELAAAYSAAAAGSRPAWGPLPVSYAAYAAWQRRQLTASGVLEAQSAWWHTALAGAPPLLELPWDSPRPAVMSGASGSAPLRMDAETVAALGRRRADDTLRGCRCRSTGALLQLVLHRLLWRWADS